MTLKNMEQNGIVNFLMALCHWWKSILIFNAVKPEIILFCKVLVCCGIHMNSTIVIVVITLHFVVFILHLSSFTRWCFSLLAISFVLMWLLHKCFRALMHFKHFRFSFLLIFFLSSPFYHIIISKWISTKWKGKRDFCVFDARWAVHCTAWYLVSSI